MVWAILSIKVENKPGILFKVTHLFRSRNFNIDSISVGVTEDKKYSRMTITTIGDEKQITQIVKQLDKMIDTIEVRRLDVNNSVYRELVMFKIKVSKPEDSMEIATPHQISAFEELAKKFGIKEMARTGITALEREEHEH